MQRKLMTCPTFVSSFCSFQWKVCVSDWHVHILTNPPDSYTFYYTLQTLCCVFVPCFCSSSVISRKHLQALWHLSSLPWPFAPLSWWSVACRPCMRWKEAAKWRADREGWFDCKETLHWSEVKVTYMWLGFQHRVDCCEDGAEEQRPPRFLPGTLVHHCEGDTRLLLLFWGLWAVSLQICTVHGHRQREHRYVCILLYKINDSFNKEICSHAFGFCRDSSSDVQRWVWWGLSVDGGLSHRLCEVQDPGALFSWKTTGLQEDFLGNCTHRR